MEVVASHKVEIGASAAMEEPAQVEQVVIKVRRKRGSQTFLGLAMVDLVQQVDIRSQVEFEAVLRSLVEQWVVNLLAGKD